MTMATVVNTQADLFGSIDKHTLCCVYILSAESTPSKPQRWKQDFHLQHLLW